MSKEIYLSLYPSICLGIFLSLSLSHTLSSLSLLSLSPLALSLSRSLSLSRARALSLFLSTPAYLPKSKAGQTERPSCTVRVGFFFFEEWV